MNPLPAIAAATFTLSSPLPAGTHVRDAVDPVVTRTLPMSLFTTTLFIGGNVHDIRTQRMAPPGRYTLSGYLCIVFEGTGLTYRWATVGGLTSFDVIVEGQLPGVPPLSALCQPDDDWLKDTPQDIHPPAWE